MKYEIGHFWNIQLTTRKFVYWNMANNFNPDMYEKGFNSIPPVLPRKIQINEIPGEPQPQRNLREEMPINKINLQIKLLRLRVETTENLYKDTGQKMEIENTK